MSVDGMDVCDLKRQKGRIEEMCYNWLLVDVFYLSFRCVPTTHCRYHERDRTANKNIYLRIQQTFLTGFPFPFRVWNISSCPLSAKTCRNHFLCVKRTVALPGPLWRTHSFSGNSCMTGFLLTAEFDLLLHLRVLFHALLEFGKITFNYLCCFL